MAILCIVGMAGHLLLRSSPLPTHLRDDVGNLLDANSNVSATQQSVTLTKPKGSRRASHMDEGQKRTWAHYEINV